MSHIDQRRVIREVDFDSGAEILARRMKMIIAADGVTDCQLGDHFHKETRECVWVLEGEITRLSMRNVGSSGEASWSGLGPGSMVRVEPNVWHLFVLGAGCILMVVSSASAEQEEQDTFKLEEE